jgi:arylsulfatase A-like enzyme
MAAKISRRESLKVLSSAAVGVPALGLLGAAAGQPRPPRDAPNILFFLTDDQQQAAMSAYGHRILKTPNMDRLAAEGLRFTEAFVTNSLCAPSRASFLTGLYSHAHGVITNGDGPLWRNQPGLRSDQLTFAHLLRETGYHTMLVGKWHIRSWPTGFDQWNILPGQGAYHDPEMIANGVRVKLRGHVEDAIGDQALALLRERPTDAPFCLLCWFKAPHRDWRPAARFEKVFDDVEMPAPRTFEDRLEGRPDALRKAEMAIADMPDFRDRGVPLSLPPEERKRRNLQMLLKNYYRVLLGVDENVGRVLEFLDKDKDGLAENTAVFYSSDNGFFLGEHGLFDKRLMYEPSIRIPMLLRYPARVARGRVDSTHLVLNIDVAPTILQLGGVPVPTWMHGRSWLPVIASSSSALASSSALSPSWRDAFLYEYYEYPASHCVRKNRGIRTDRWKLIHFWEQPEEWELYDLQADPDETTNLGGRREHAATIARLRARLEELRREVGDADPPGPPLIAVPCTSGTG